MDLSQFKASTGSSANKSKGVKKSNKVTQKLIELKNWAYPSISTQRQSRMLQYKSFAIFAGAIITVAYF